MTLREQRQAALAEIARLDVRFACTCSHASNVHPPFPVMR